MPKKKRPRISLDEQAVQLEAYMQSKLEAAYPGDLKDIEFRSTGEVTEKAGRRTGDGTGKSRWVIACDAKKAGGSSVDEKKEACRGTVDETMDYADTTDFGDIDLREMLRRTANRRVKRLKNDLRKAKEMEGESDDWVAKGDV